MDLSDYYRERKDRKNNIRNSLIAALSKDIIIDEIFRIDYRGLINNKFMTHDTSRDVSEKYGIWCTNQPARLGKKFARRRQTVDAGRRGRRINNFYGTKIKIEISRVSLIISLPALRAAGRYRSSEVDALPTLRYAKFIFRGPGGGVLKFTLEVKRNRTKMSIAIAEGRMKRGGGGR